MQEAREPGSKQPGSDASSGEHPFSGHSSGQGSGGEAGGRSLATPRQAVQQVMRDLGAADADKVRFHARYNSEKGKDDVVRGLPGSQTRQQGSACRHCPRVALLGPPCV
jgi:hypothetical protein